MLDSNQTRRRVGGGLLTVGLIILLGVAGYIGWSQLQAAQLRAQLRLTPVQPAEVASPNPAVFPTLQPTLTFAPPASVAPALSPTVAPSPTVSVGAKAGLTDPAPPTVQPAVSPPTATVRPPAVTQPGADLTVTPVVAAAAPVRLVVADLKIDAKVVSMGWAVVQTANGPRSEWVIPKNEAGHHINSALLGQQGNVVISGHNNIYGQVFKPISFAWDDDKRIKVDDFADRSEILNGRRVQLFDAAGNVYTYTISEFYRLKDTGVSFEQRLANGRFMDPTEDARLTLITCWPPTNNTHRLVVIAKPAQ